MSAVYGSCKSWIVTTRSEPPPRPCTSPLRLYPSSSPLWPRRWAARVIERDGRNVRLTGAARVLLDHAGELFAQLELLDSDLARHQSGEVGTVRVGAFQTASSGIVVPAATALARTHPRLEIELIQMDAPMSFMEVAAGRLDIAISVEFVGQPAGW